VQARQMQRAMFAERCGDREAARRHFLPAGHCEDVLAHDYDTAGEADLALRSRSRAASCWWSGGAIDQGRQALEALHAQHPAQATGIAEVIAELTRDYPPANRA
jgi:hypothetical protein